MEGEQSHCQNNHCQRNQLHHKAQFLLIGQVGFPSDDDTGMQQYQDYRGVEHGQVHNEPVASGAVPEILLEADNHEEVFPDRNHLASEAEGRQPVF